jgi:hypothetical protein
MDYRTKIRELNFV